MFLSLFNKFVNIDIYSCPRKIIIVKTLNGVIEYLEAKNHRINYNKKNAMEYKNIYKKKYLLKLLDIRTILPIITTSSGLMMQSYAQSSSPKPNLVFVFADQWRAQDIGFEGNKQVITPNIDKLADEAVVFKNAISNCPVSSPARASLMTGQYPLTHGVFYNDKQLNTNSTCIAEAYKNNGYKTGYIGKWHINGRDNCVTVQESRNRPVPKERRRGFDFWKVNECTHDYNNSVYYDEENVKHIWDGYDAIAQTQEAIKFIKDHTEDPFVLFLSWGPPHAPYETAPEKYQAMYRNSNILLRPNVPDSVATLSREWIRGYYAHISALDECVGQLQSAIKESGIEKNTIFVFTSDHGDMLGSHGEIKKQKPWEESILIPFIIKYPEKLNQREIKKVFSFHDIMPTLLGLSKLKIPKTVEGIDFSGELLGEENLVIDGALITCPVPFHQWSYKKGGREYRGLRTEKYTYVVNLDGPWLFFDNINDPYQLNNLCNKIELKEIQSELDKKLREVLNKRRDKFLEGKYYMGKWNYQWDGEDSLKIGE